MKAALSAPEISCVVMCRSSPRSTPVKAIASLAQERCGFFNLFQAEEAID
ncbi:hypothetical protein [Variovorax atrisoli]